MSLKQDKIRVVVADDSEIMRETYKSLFENQDLIEVVGMAADGAEALMLAEVLKPEVAILDIQMPKMTGIEVANRMIASRPRVGIVVISTFDDTRYILELFKERPAGKAYLLKRSLGRVDDLVRSIEAVAAGWTVLDPQIVENLIVYYATRFPSYLEGLTLNEKKVLELIAEGYSHNAISKSLDVAEGTVDNQVEVIYEKLRLPVPQTHDRRVEAVLTLVNPGT
ncbi:MAG: response regulator transcription factor [Chloroflexi bacterium]|nr:response regulator transcription factor [Chloroflexota bacterium]